jgi:hypothetical protein
MRTVAERRRMAVGRSAVDAAGADQHIAREDQAMMSRQGNATGYTTAADRRCRELIDFASLAGPMAGQYVAQQESASARRVEVTQWRSLRSAQVDQAAPRSVLARLWLVAEAGLERAGERLRGRRGVTPQATGAAPVAGAR